MESLQISEAEAESGDCVSKLDFGGDSPSRPNSDIADVSLEQLCICICFSWAGSLCLGCPVYHRYVLCLSSAVHYCNRLLSLN